MTILASEASWQDEEWLANSTSNQFLQQPFLINGVHLGNWKRKEDGQYAHLFVAEKSEVI